MDDPRTLEEIEKLLEEPKEDYIEKIVKLSWDGRNFVIRIPKQIADYLNIRNSNKMLFHVDTHVSPSIEKLKCQLI